MPLFTEGDFELLLPEHEAVFAYRRSSQAAEQLLVAANFYGDTISDPLAEEEKGMRVLFRNYEDEGAEGKLRPYEAVWYYRA